MSRRIQQTIPEPYEDIASLHTSVKAIKELIETLTGQRNFANDTAVTWEELVELGLITKEQIPQYVGIYRPK